MVIQLSYIAPFEYHIDDDGEYVEIRYIGRRDGNYSFSSITNGELDEWSAELKRISNYMVELHIKSKEKNG